MYMDTYVHTCIHTYIHMYKCMVLFLDISQGRSCAAGRWWQCSSGHKELDIQGSVINKTNSAL